MGLHILHSIASVNPAGGGPVESIRQVASVIQRDGHVTEVVCLDDPDAEWVRDFPLPCHALGPARGIYRYSPRFVPWLGINRARYDCVIVHGIWQYASYGVRQALRGSSTPYFVFPHGMMDPWFKRNYPLKHLKKSLYWPWAEYRVLRDATAVLFTCEEERLLARESFRPYRCNEVTVLYGTNAPPGDADAQREAFLRRFPHLRGRRCLLFLGRLHEKKGLDLLLRAFTRELAETPSPSSQPPHLIVAGPADHAYGAQMRGLASLLRLDSHITWTGMLRDELKWGAFRASDAFILPSHQENFGIAVAEAMACGVPVLISNRVNIWREIEKDDAGFVEQDDLSGTQRLLRRWLTADPAAWARMRTAAVRSFSARFHVEAASASLLSVLRTYRAGRPAA